jgi:hypothetical protein
MLPNDTDGPTYRLKKERDSSAITLIARDDESGEILEEFRFDNIQDAHDVANAIMDVALDPPAFVGWDVSLHG